jgi:mono/diheme cytochrome c family protein
MKWHGVLLMKSPGLMLYGVLGLVIAFSPVKMAVSADLNDNGSGRYTFESMCAICHGADARGNGTFAKQLTAVPPDLTVLAQKNNGILPSSRIYEIIDGGNVIAAHGTREMPIWGLTMTRTRILTVLDYLAKIQRR